MSLAHKYYREYEEMQALQRGLCTSGPEGSSSDPRGRAELPPGGPPLGPSPVLAASPPHKG